jgi:hypothetical protein
MGWADDLLADLILDHFVRYDQLNLLCDSAELLLHLPPQVAISFGSALITYLYLDQDTYSFGEKSISSPLLVVLMAFISSYAVAGASKTLPSRLPWLTCCSFPPFFSHSHPRTSLDHQNTCSWSCCNNPEHTHAHTLV